MKNGTRQNFDSSTSPQTLENQLQYVIDNIIRSCPDVDWSEDHISYLVVAAIRYVLGGYCIPNTDLSSDISKFDVEAYKLTSPAEKMHGDIAIVVSRFFDGHQITGVGFYEAKASLDGYKYPAYSFQQLRRLVTNTPKLSYLLYDKNSDIADVQEWPTLEERDDFKTRNNFHARVIDANIIKQFKSLTAAAHFMSQSFGYHFVHKILSGRELDYSRPPIETIRRWLKETRRTTSLVISVAIQENESYHIPAQLQLPEFEKIIEGDKTFRLP